MTIADPKALLEHFAPVVYLHSEEEYKPVSVEGYLQECSLRYDTSGPGSEEVLKHINDNNPGERIDQQQYGSGSDVVYSSYLRTPKETAFYTTLNESSHKYGNEVVNVPFYCAAFESGTDEGTRGHCDLIYGFFYAWDGSNAGILQGAAGLFAAHEGDWEHVIVRIGRDSAKGYSTTSSILGVYFQAHKQTDRYSNWYYPPASGASSEKLFAWEVENQRVRVYASNGSHGSYTTAGTQPYRLLWPDDETDQGTRWDAPIVVMTGDESWNNYNGRFGDHGGPFSPKVKDWLRVDSRQGGPDGKNIIKVTPDKVSELSDTTDTGPYSEAFKLGYRTLIEWKVEAQNVPEETLSHLRFDIMRVGAFPPDSVFQGLRSGQVTGGYFQDALVVGFIWLDNGNEGTVGNLVFNALKVDEILLTARALRAHPREAGEVVENVNPAVAEGLSVRSAG